MIACISVFYAIGFAVYLTRLHNLLREGRSQPRFLASWVLVGGVLFITLHGVSDIGITGLVGAKVAAYSAVHDPGLSYALYLLTFALDSVGDVFGALFMLATGLLVIASRTLPRWLGWVAILVSPFFFLQVFGLGGVIGSFGLVLDLIGFVLFLIFVLVSSAILLKRGDAALARIRTTEERLAGSAGPDRQRARFPSAVGRCAVLDSAIESCGPSGSRDSISL